MLAQKFDTKILKDGTIKLPKSIMFKKDTEVEVIILEKIKKNKTKISAEKELTAVGFFNKWVGVLKKNDDDYLEYVEYKNK
jgi:hypothetical protein